MRTKKTVLNFITSFFPWIFLAVLGFVKIKLFISNYGSELNGLVQLVAQLYSYLTIMEAGFGAAITYSLYKPFADKDKEKISKLFNGSKIIYRKIGSLIFIGGILLGIIAPFFIDNLAISKSYVFFVFGLYALDYFSLYVFGLPYQTLLAADQKNYKTNIIRNTRHLFFKSVEIILIINKFDLLLMIFLSSVFNVIANIILIKETKKEYPWLDSKIKEDMTPLGMTKDVFFLRIAKLVLNSTDGILLSTFCGLTAVSIYGAYNYIISFLRQMFDFLVSSAKYSFGNLFVDDSVSKEKRNSVINEYIILSFYFSILIVSIFTISINKFIEVWINQDYVLAFITTCMFSSILWLDFIQSPILSITEACGKYKEMKKPVLIASILNIILSLILVNKYEILGVLIATAISYLLVSLPAYINFVFKHIINENIKYYYKKALFFSAILIIIISFNYLFIEKFDLYNNINFFNWVFNTFILGITNILIITPMFLLFSKSFKNSINRILKLRRK